MKTKNPVQNVTPPVGIEPGPHTTSDLKSNTTLSALSSVHAPLDFWTLKIQLESIEHNYIRNLKSQSYKQMST